MMMQTDGQLQSLTDFVARLDGDGYIVENLKKAVTHCVDVDPEAPGRDASHDICLIPPSTRVIDLAMKSMVDSTLPTG